MSLVSICIPVYGVENYIEKCCRSLFGQSYPNIEYLFVDDCTPDNSIRHIYNVLEDFPHRKSQVKIIKHERNKGLSSARNTAIAASTGDYLMHVDSDDYIDIDVVERLLARAQETAADVVLYDIRYVYSDKTFIKHLIVPNSKEECVKNTLLFKLNVCVWGGLYSSKLIKKNGIRFVDGLNFGEDYVTKPRILYYANKIVHCEGCYYNYVQYNISSYTKTYKPKNVEDLICAIAILTDFFQIQKDFSIYKDCINIAHLYVKVHLLIDVCLHKPSVGALLPKVASLYEDKSIYSKFLPLPFRILLFFAKHHCYRFLWIYANVATYINLMLKKKE